MKRIISFPGTVLIALALMTGSIYAETAPAPAAPAAPAALQHGNLDRKDHEFLKKAAQINLTEIELGKLAERLSTDPNVKKIAGMLVKDHAEANQKLERLAASKGASIPQEPSIWERHSLNALQKEQGAKFNEEFLAFSAKGHEKAIALFEKEAARTQDPDIKAWAQKTLPELKHHLAMSQGTKAEAVAEKAKQHKQQ